MFYTNIHGLFIYEYKNVIRFFFNLFLIEHELQVQVNQSLFQDVTILANNNMTKNPFMRPNRECIDLREKHID